MIANNKRAAQSIWMGAAYVSLFATLLLAYSVYLVPIDPHDAFTGSFSPLRCAISVPVAFGASFLFYSTPPPAPASFFIHLMAALTLVPSLAVYTGSGQPHFHLGMIVS